MRRAKDGAESRFQGGIHFRTDNEAGLELGKHIGAYIVNRNKKDGIEWKNELSQQRNGPMFRIFDSSVAQRIGTVPNKGARWLQNSIHSSVPTI